MSVNLHASNILHTLSLKYDRKRFLIIFLIVFVALLIDVSISVVADIVSEQTVTFWGIVLFVVISSVYVFGQYFMLEMTKAKNKEIKINHPAVSIVEKTATIVTYVLTLIIVYSVLQILVLAHYNTILLSVATAISYGLAVFFMSILAYRLLIWFKLNRSLVVLLYGLAAIMISANAVDSIIFFDFVLLDKPALTSSQSPVIFQVGFNPGTAMSYVSTFQAYSLNGYFLLTWAGTILLLRHHMQRVGRVKFWILVSLPIIFFMSYYISYYQAFNPSSPVTTVISSNFVIPIYMIMISITLCGVLFGIGFWSVGRSISSGSHVRDYMVITACGFILYFSCGQATVLQAGYPPFGLANVSFVGISSFLILSGLYNSAVSVANDVRLRQSIKRSTINESKLLGSIVTAETQLEMEKKVMTITKKNARIIAEESGVDPSLTDDEIKEYVAKVIKEVHMKSRISDNR